MFLFLILFFNGGVAEEKSERKRAPYTMGRVGQNLNLNFKIFRNVASLHFESSTFEFPNLKLGELCLGVLGTPIINLKAS